jgi:hypothetical protein
MRISTDAMMHTTETVRPHGFFKRLLFWIMDWDDPAFIEEGRRRLYRSRNLFDTLPPEALEHLREARRRNEARMASHASAGD